MKVIIGDTYTFYLKDNIPIEERLNDINKLLNEIVEFDGTSYKIEDYFRHTWDKKSTKIALDIIGYYLSKKPNQNGKHDGEVLTKSKEKEMVFGLYKGEKRYTNFTYLSRKDQLKFGFKDYEDELETKKRKNQDSS